jgi:hypothetical protein
MSRSSKEWFPSKFLKAEDLGANRPIVTIQHVELEPVGKGKETTDKPVLYFAEPKVKPLVLNKINTEMIDEVAGTDDPDLWPGVRIQLYATKTDFQGKRVDCVRVCAPPARPVAKPVVPRGRAAAVPMNDADSDVDAPADDGVGF